jgi:hypothetical protein
MNFVKINPTYFSSRAIAINGYKSPWSPFLENAQGNGSASRLNISSLPTSTYFTITGKRSLQPIYTVQLGNKKSLFLKFSVSTCFGCCQGSL